MIAGSRPVRTTTFGIMPDGRPVKEHTLSNASGMQVSFLDLGGIIRVVKVPDRYGMLADVTPGYDSLAHYLDDTRFFGAIIGRYANRIANAAFTLDGVAHHLPPNDGRNQLHGGRHGLHSVLWSVAPFVNAAGSGAVLSYASPDGDEGYPGTLQVRVTYTLTNDNALTFDYWAVTDATTPVNFTQHAYFNLAGHASGTVLDHELTLHAPSYLPVDDELIPTGEIRPVQGTPFDFRTSRPIREGNAAHAFIDYDHNFVVDPMSLGAMQPVARLHDPRTGRTLVVESSEPGIQFYSGNQIGNGHDGKSGCHYAAYSSLALETQHYPNSPNEPRFPSTILRPGTEYRSRTSYRFSAT